MISASDRYQAMELIEEARRAGARLRPACEQLGLSVRSYLRAVLEDAEFNVLTASDGDEALKTVREQAVDFISLDLVMPKRSGQKVLYELRKDKALS